MCRNTTRRTSGDRRRGAIIRRSPTTGTVLDSIRASTSDSASAVGAAGAGAAGVGAGARTGSGARCSSTAFSSTTTVSTAGCWPVDLRAERGGSTTRAIVWELLTRTLNSPAGIRPHRWLRGARWQDQGSFNSARPAGAGNWSRFGSGTTSAYGNRSVTQGARNAAPQSAGRATTGQWQHFQGSQGYSAPAQRYSAPAQRYSAPAQRYSAPGERYSAPAQRYSAPAQRYSAPSPGYQSAPRMSAPSYSGGGRSFGGGGGGGSRSFGGGGGHSSGGGGGHRR